MKYYTVLLLAALSLAACKTKKKKENAEAFFPIASFLKSQVKHIDTSLYRIVHVEKEGNNPPTKTYLKREDFRKAAEPFLNLPDISTEKWSDDYEESKIFDPEMNKVILTYTTANKENEIQREDVVLEQTQENSNVQNIIIHQVKNEANATIVRNMVWYVNKRFTIVTKTTKEGQPERVNTIEVIWNDFIDPQTN
jgi:hypothetical protein